MMIIGKYTVYDWEEPSHTFWVRKFYCVGFYLGNIRIGVVPHNHLIFTFIGKIKSNYINMYGSDPKVFQSIDEAKEHVDIFLEKLQKLKAFL